MSSEAEERLEAVRPIYPLYPLTKGVDSWDLQRAITFARTVIDDVPDLVPEALRARRDLPGARTAYDLIHAPDDFGEPETAFNFCTFWFIEALHQNGRIEEARAIFEEMLNRRTVAGLLSEDISIEDGELWGNYPQTYSLVGIINCAVLLSRSWTDVR